MNSAPRNRRLPTSNDDSFPRSYLATDVRRQPQVFRGRYSSSPSWNPQAANALYNRRINNAVQPPQSADNSQQLTANRKRRGSSVGEQQPTGPPNVKYRRESQSSKQAAQKAHAKYSKLTEQITNSTKAEEQSDELLQKKLRLRSALLSVFRKEFPAATLHLVGSSCNGFANANSDADFCLMLTNHRMVDQKYEAVAYLRRLQSLLKGCAFIQRLQVIKAKVPILKFKDVISGCDCDININNSVGIRNTHLLRTYSRVDDRVAPLVKIVKRWAKASGINDASEGTLSSYSLVLMVIHFLQSGCKPAILTSLQQEFSEYFSADRDVDQLPQFEPADYIPCNRSSNTKSMGELLLAFFEYFAIHYRWDVLAVSIRLGRATPKALNFEWRDKFICIEEPFELTNTARAVYARDRFALIRSRLVKAHDKLKETLSLDSLFQ